MSVSFKGAHFPKDVILHAVFFYLRYGVSYRDLEEIMAERGVTVDHATLNRWVERYAGQVAEDARRRKRPTDRSWRMDETYIKVKGQWVYLYRAVDKFGKTLDFMLSERRNKPAAIKFFARAMEVNGLPRKIVIDKSAANTEGIKDINRMLKRFGCPVPIEMVRIKYLNNLVEQDHRFIKRRVRHMLSFKSIKSFKSAASTIAGIELVNMSRKGAVQTRASLISAVLSNCRLTLRQSSTPCVSTPNLRQNQSSLVYFCYDTLHSDRGSDRYSTSIQQTSPYSELPWMPEVRTRLVMQGNGVL